MKNTTENISVLFNETISELFEEFKTGEKPNNLNALCEQITIELYDAIPELKENEALAHALVYKNPDFYAHIKAEFKNNAITLYAVDKNAENFQFVTDKQKNESGLAELAITKDKSMFEHVGERLLKDREFIALAINKNIPVFTYPFLSDEIKNDMELALKALSYQAARIQTFGEDSSTNGWQDIFSILEEALKTYENISSSLQEHPDFAQSRELFQNASQALEAASEVSPVCPVAGCIFLGLLCLVPIASVESVSKTAAIALGSAAAALLITAVALGIGMGVYRENKITEFQGKISEAEKNISATLSKNGIFARTSMDSIEVSVDDCFRVEDELEVALLKS